MENNIMPIPSKRKDEDKSKFMSRCMSDNVMNKEYPDQSKRTAICISKACEGLNYVQAADFQMYFDAYGYEEEIDENNFYIPSGLEYVTSEEVDFETSEVEVWDISIAKPGLWENIRKKKEREGKKYKPAKPGDPDRPDPKSWKKAQSLLRIAFASYEDGQMQREQLKKMHEQLMEIEEYLEGIVFEEWTKDMISKAEVYIQNIYDFVEVNKIETEDEQNDEDESEAKFKYEDPKTGEIFNYRRKGIYKKDGRMLIPLEASEYQGRKVQLGKPFRTPSGPKKFSVYVKNEKGNVVKVNFGSPDMEIKRDDPQRRKSFRARHNCNNPGPKYKARYWSCRQWRASSPVED
jgi:hypothetical protein